jgi:mannose-1-phosphate guanylyltransferase
MNLFNHYYAVIMAGGGGTRLWPLSRQQRPKQMLRLFDERTLFQTSVARLQGLFPPENILVVTVADQAAELHAETPQIPKENFIIEPMPRGTASVVGLAAVAIQQRDPAAVMAVLTSDHYIRHEDIFRQYLRAALDVAQEGYLVTLGITPTFPATGYGYIQSGERIGAYQGKPVFRALRFKEKPDDAQAVAMFSSKDYTWNSGMFIWQVAQILKEFAIQMPDLSNSMTQIASAWKTPQKDDVLGRIWPGIKVETIDYGVMEHAQNVAVIPAADLGWSDVGSWDSLFEVLPTDQTGNIIMGGEHIGLDTDHSLVYLDQTRRLIVTIGISDLIVVDTDDVLLVCDKKQAQKVRQLVAHLKQTDQKQYI